MVVEWIPYNQFINIKEIGEGGFATVYSAVKAYFIITKDYIMMVLQYADKGSFDNYKYFFKNYNWCERITILQHIIKGLKKIHGDFHVGNILTFDFRHNFINDDAINTNRPITSEVKELIKSFVCSSIEGKDKEIKMQIEKAEEYRKTNFSYIENDQSTIHPQASYTSQLLNPFTRDLSKYDTLCLDCAIND
ncbi:kinase-like domain-containing protein [Rhizophagus clarus]|uniref:Kinase-like domain-containing protein n=1 Tax=Rhizophagus clarus TaxID=94130 RepID=A0A8H3QPX1_9GLOM|nr:kinase-like domain-containing protein [Rhizophagus clarus]